MNTGNLWSSAAFVLVVAVFFFVNGVPAPAAAEIPREDDLDQIENLIEEGDYAEAEGLARGVLVREEATHGEQSLEVALVLDLLVQCMWRGGKADDPEVLDLAERAVAIKEATLGPTNVEVADSLMELGIVLRKRQDYQAAEQVGRRTVEIYAEALGSSDPKVAKAIHNLANSLDWLGQYVEAKQLYERELEIFERAYGPDSLDSADVLLSLANVVNQLGESGEIEFLERSLAIYEREMGPDHPKVATALNNLGLTLLEHGDYLHAKEFLERSLSIRERRLGQDHIDNGGSHINLGILYSLIVDPSRAVEHYERAVKIASANSNGVMEGVALVNLGIQVQSADYLDAVQSYERALALFEDDLGPEHPRVAWVLSSLAWARLEIGDLEEARNIFNRALAMIEPPGSGGQWLLDSLHLGLAKVEAKSGNSEGAEIQIQRAIETVEKIDGPEHPEMAKALVSSAEIYLEMGDTAAAEESYWRGLSILEGLHGAGHPATIGAVAGLAEVAARNGKNARAIELYRQVVSIQESSLGPDYPGLAETLSGLAKALAAAGYGEEAFGTALRAEDLSRTRLRLATRALPERQALGFASEQDTSLDLVLALATDGPGTKRAAAAVDSLIRSRAVVLDEMARRHRLVTISDDPEVRALVAELAAARSWLANLSVRGPGDLEPEQYREVLAAAQKDKELAEGTLAEIGMSDEAAEGSEHVGLEDVSASIRLDEALVTFARFERHPNQPGDDAQSESPEPVPFYLAFVLRGGQSTPTLVDLGDAEAIDQLVLDVQRQMARVSGAPEMAGKREERAYRIVANALRSRVWDPMAPHLEGTEKVLVVPDGGMNLVSFAALPTGESDYLIDGGMEILYLSAERDLASTQANATGAGLVALGDVAFDRPVRISLLDERDEQAFASVGLPGERQIFRGPRSSCGKFQQMRFQALPASAKELDEIVALWTSDRVDAESRSRLRGPSNDVKDVVRLDGATASEAAFKILAPGRRGLHLATHGFFLGGDCPSALDSRADTSADVEDRTFAENPLLLSGLALAGANLREEAGEGEDDGILTAEEIASIDLSGVEWAVLSACNTGAGEIRAGEGVFGLRRAFRVAGVATLVMSLWPVEDEASRVWMNAFYGQRFQEGQGIAGAVHTASLDALTARRAEGQSTHPFFWAGFVAAGQ